MNCCTERSKNIFTRELRMGKKNHFQDGKDRTGSVFECEPLSISLLFFRLTFDDDKCKASSTLQQNKELHLYL